MKSLAEIDKAVATSREGRASHLLVGLGCVLGVVAASQAAWAATTDWGVGLRSEVAGGLAPRRYGADQASEPVVAVEMLPTSAFRAMGQRFTLTTRFQQRWYFRQPNLMGYERPLLLNRLFGTFDGQLTPRLALTMNANAVAGAMDFMAVPTMMQQPSTQPGGTNSVTPPGASIGRTSTVPNAAIVQLFTWFAMARLSYQLSPRQEVDASLSTTRQVPINGGSSSLRTTQQGSIATGYGYQASSSTQLRSLATFSIIEATTATYQSLSVSQSIMHAWSARTTTSALLGVTGFNAPVRIPRTLDERASSARELRLFPSAGFTLTHLHGPEQRRTTLNASASLTGFFDPMTSNLRSTAGLSLSAIRVLDRRWTVSARLDSMLPTSTRPLSLAGGGRAGETYLSTSVGLGRLIGTQARFDTGLRYSFFGTHPTTFEVLTQQAWIYAGIAIWDGTDRATRGGFVL